MYLSHYGLKKRPFSLSPNPEFLWLGEKHHEALSVLQYGIQEDKGFLLLTGDIGIGKTALINYLVTKIKDKMIVATVPNPNLELMDFYNILADEFQMNRSYKSKGEFLIQFEKFLLKAHSRKTRVLIIIDEAQKINSELLDEVRVLSNIELPERKLLSIFFVGQTEFNDLILEERNKPLRQRITIRHHIQPLDETETQSYIDHRIQVAGARDPLFHPDAIRQIFQYSDGYPRLINNICDHALMTGYVRDAQIIGRDVIEECQKELDLQKPQRSATQKTAPQAAPPSPGERKKSNRMYIGGIFFLFLLLGVIFFSTYNRPPDQLPAEPEKPTEPQSAQTVFSGKISDRGSDALSPEPKPAAGSADKKTSPLTNRVDNEDGLTAEAEFSATVTPQAAAEEPSSLPLPPSSEITKPEERRLSSVTKADRSDAAPQNRLAEEFTEKKVIVHFKWESEELTQQALEMLDSVIRLAKEHADSNVLVEGYTDSSGGYAYNLTLSKVRANIVKTYLVYMGVPAERVEVVGNGPENPIAGNETPEGRAMNRRVEVTVEREK